MVWLEKSDCGALAHIPNIWANIRDGRPVSQIPRPTFGFRVTKPFTSPTTNKEFLPGMQGQVLQCQGDGAYVQVRDLFDDQGNFLKDWIYRGCIEIGTKPYGSWEIDTSLIPRQPSKLTEKERETLSDPSSKHLATAIMAFLKTLAKTDPDCLTSDNLAKLGGLEGTKVAWITSTIVEGVRKAGLLSTLNNPNFSIRDLVMNANFDCTTTKSQGEAGFYFRFYVEPSPVQLKKLCSLYVGQSFDLKNRADSWANGTQHEELIQRSHRIDMRAICRVPRVFYADYNYIVEQLFTSLLQTYRSVLADAPATTNVDDARGTFHLKSCHDMEKIAKQAAVTSGWTGAVRRSGFWEGDYAACAGLNFQSPITESPAHENYSWLRTDSYVPDKWDKSGKSIPFSNFIREAPRRMTVMNPTLKSATKEKFFIIFNLRRKDGSYLLRVTRGPKDELYQDGVQWPADNTYFDVIFEVRTDWKPHPYSWACLPLYGPFEDWSRANSWALAMQWTDMAGNHRRRYLHCERPLKLLEPKSNGSIQAYARGIEVIHWLFREKISAEHQHYWLETPPMASIKVVKHDHVRQTITLEDAGRITSTAPISSQRKHPSVIKQELNGLGVHGNANLQHIGYTQKKARAETKVKFGNRKKCDTCAFMTRGSTHAKGCKEDKNGVCEVCLNVFGRPFCTWTPGIPFENSHEALKAAGDEENILRRKALLGLPGWRGDDTMSADPVLVAVDTGDEEEQELTDAEVAQVDNMDRMWAGP